MYAVWHDLFSHISFFFQFAYPCVFLLYLLESSHLVFANLMGFKIIVLIDKYFIFHLNSAVVRAKQTTVIPSQCENSVQFENI